MSNQETLEHILDLLDDEEGISFKRMFGGYGLFKNELAVALILRSEIFMKVDQSNINDYKSAFSKPFTYKKNGKDISLSNWSIPSEILEDKDFLNFKISVKSSDVFLSIAAYRQLSKVIDYPLHLGITEAGSFVSGSIKSSIGLGSLLMDGIGDTIRISLSDNPTQEVKIGNEILKSLNLRNRGVKIISCPSCARQAFQVIDTVKILEEKLAHIKTPITLSIIGCVVNGPGEAAMTDIGITGGGKGNNMLYLSGVQNEKVLTDDIINKVISEVEKKASELEN